MDAIALGLIKKYIDQKFSNSSSEAATYQAAVQNHFEGLGTVVNVLTKNINNDGTLTDLSLALKTNAIDTIYYFPKGTYRIEGFSFNGAHNVTIYAPEAKFIYDSTGQQTFILEFKNCENIKLIGGIFDGDNLVQNGLSFNNCPNTTIQDTYIHNIGNADLGYTAGIDFVNDCGHTILTNVKVDNVQAGKVTLTGDAGYIFATGIRFKAGSSGYSKDVLIDHPIISNIGYLIDGNEKIYYVPATKNGTLYYVDNNACVKDIITDEGYNGTGTAKARIDGDGIHFAQRPDEVADREGKTHAVIRNPQITNCAKRALKIATRCVEIDGGNIDTSSWSTAVGFQYTGGSIIKNTTIRNNTYTCMTVLADGKMTVDNCTFLSTDGAGNGLALTFEQKFNDTQGNPINPLPENLMITGCHFEDVNHPIIAMLTSISERKVDSNSIKIENCEFGYFKGEAAIYLHPNRFNSIRSLSIKDNIFTYKSSIADMHADNLAKYGEECSETQQVLYLGTAADGSHVDPIELIEVDNSALAEDFDTFFRLFRFTARRKFLGGTPARADWVFEYPEMLNITAGTYESDFGTGDPETFCNCTVDAAGGITAYAHAKESILRTLIPIAPVTFETDKVYDLVSMAQNSNGESLILDAGITVRLYNAAKQEITAARGALNQAERRIILSSLSATATYVSVVCSPQQKSDDTWIGQNIPENTKIFVSLKSRKPEIKNQALYAPIESPQFTGTPVAPTAVTGTNTQQIATTAFVKNTVDNLILPEFFNVEDYGAVANDISSATTNVTAFNSAITAAKAQGKGVLIPNKTFYINGTVIIDSANNFEIRNKGKVVSIALVRDTDSTNVYRAAFTFQDCENTIFTVGELTSERSQRGKAPSGHTRVPQDGFTSGKSSNITAIQVNTCNNLTIRDGIITNMEYATYLARTSGITASNFDTKSSGNVLVDNLKISSTSQPFLINAVKNMTIKNCNVDSCALMGTGDHHVYVCDFVNYIRIEDCVFNFVDNYYGPALNFFNSYLGTSGHDGWSVKQAEVINCRVTNARYQRIVTGNGDSEIIIDGCDFRYLDTGNSFSADISAAVNEWNNYYGEGNITADTMSGRRGVFNIGSANCKLSIIVRNTSIIDPINCGQLVSGWVYPWTLSFKNCNIKLGFLASYNTKGDGLFNNPSLTLSNCDITVSRWLLTLKTMTSNNANAVPVKVLFTNCRINCLHNGATQQILTTSVGTEENQKPTELRIIGCQINGMPNATMIKNTSTSGEDALTSSVIILNNTIEGFGIFVATDKQGQAIIHNNYINGIYE